MTDPTPPVDPTEGATPEQSPAAPPATPPAPPATPVDAAGQPMAPGAPQAPMNTLAIIAFIASFFVSIAGIIMGHIALSQIKKSGERGRGFALAGTIIGYVAFVGTIIAIIMSLVFAAMVVSAANDASNELSQATEQSESADPDATTEEPAEPAGDRSAEFCDAFNALRSTEAAATDDQGALTPEAMAFYDKVAAIQSPNQDVYKRFITVLKDPSTIQQDESPETLPSEYAEAAAEDTTACM